MTIIDKLPLEKYPNFLNEIKYNYDDAIKNLENILYVSGDEDDKNSYTELNNVPIFVYSFCSYLKRNNKLPNFIELWDYYLKFNDNVLSSDYKYGGKYYNGLLYRFSKTYPSLIREHLFLLYLNKKLSNYEVIYNSKLDVYAKIDVLLHKDNMLYGLKLYADTINSLSYLNNKASSLIFSNVNIIKLVLNIDTAVLKINNFSLYSDTEVKILLNKIINQNFD